MRLTGTGRPATGQGPNGKEAPIMVIVGARWFLQGGPLAAPGEAWSERVLMAPSGVHRLRAGSPCYRALVNLTVIDFPVTDPMRTSASEP